MKRNKRFSTLKIVVIGLVNILQGLVCILSLGFIWPTWDMDIVIFFTLQERENGQQPQTS